MNENSSSEWFEFSSKSLSHQSFPHPVVQAIAENETFMYPELLPSFYDQKSVAKLPFLCSEDALLIYGLDQLRDSKMSWKCKAKPITELLLTPRPLESVYHRLRNLRKKGNTIPDVVKKYFENNILPSGAVPPLEVSYLSAPISQPREKLPQLWQGFVSMLTEDIGVFDTLHILLTTI